MISNQILQSTIEGLRSITRIDLCVLDAEGKEVALKVYEVAKEPCAHGKECGTLVTDGKSYVKVAVEGGYVSLVEVQLAGKKRMPVADLLRGFSISAMSVKL